MAAGVYDISVMATGVLDISVMATGVLEVSVMLDVFVMTTGLELRFRVLLLC